MKSTFLRWFFYILFLLVFLRLGLICYGIYKVSTYSPFSCSNDAINYLYAKNIMLAHSSGIRKCMIGQFIGFGVVTLILMIGSAIHYFLLLGRQRLRLLLLLCLLEGILILGFSMYVARYKGGKCDRASHKRGYKEIRKFAIPDDGYKRYLE